MAGREALPPFGGESGGGPSRDGSGEANRSDDPPGDEWNSDSGDEDEVAPAAETAGIQLDPPPGLGGNARSPSAEGGEPETDHPAPPPGTTGASESTEEVEINLQAPPSVAEGMVRVVQAAARTAGVTLAAAPSAGQALFAIMAARTAMKADAGAVIDTAMATSAPDGGAPPAAAMMARNEDSTNPASAEQATAEVRTTGAGNLVPPDNRSPDPSPDPRLDDATIYGMEMPGPGAAAAAAAMAAGEGAGLPPMASAGGWIALGEQARSRAAADSLRRSHETASKRKAEESIADGVQGRKKTKLPDQSQQQDTRTRKRKVADDDEIEGNSSDEGPPRRKRGKEEDRAGSTLDEGGSREGKTAAAPKTKGKAKAVAPNTTCRDDTFKNKGRHEDDEDDKSGGGAGGVGEAGDAGGSARCRTIKRSRPSAPALGASS